MAIVLKSLISNVRSALSDVPTEFLTDAQILVELRKSQAFCDAVMLSSTPETYLSQCYTVVATYYSYVNYTTLSERQLGTLPPTSSIRVKALQQIAASFLQVYSAMPITNDLMIDTKSYQQSMTAAVALTPSNLEL